MRVELIGRPEPQVTGLSRYTAGLREGLETAGLDVHLTHPTRPPFPVAMVRTLKRRGVPLSFVSVSRENFTGSTASTKTSRPWRTPYARFEKLVSPAE